MSEFVNLKIQLDSLRLALNDKILHGHSMREVRAIYFRMANTKKLMSEWRTKDRVVTNN